MNWKVLYDKPKKGDKVIVIGKNCDPRYYDKFPEGTIFTLRDHYIIDGKWLANDELFATAGANYWDTEECNGGIEEKSFKVVR